jgi:hypothetical protein
MKTSSWGVQRKKRDYIELWVFLLLLFSVNFFDLLPITRVIGPNGPFTFYLVSLFLVFTFHRRAWIRDSMHWLIPFWWFLLGIVLSYVPALLHYGQSFTQSFFTNRRIFEFTAFPILIALRPTERELRTSLYSFSVVYLFLTLFVTFLAPGWVFVPPEASFIEEGDYVHNLSGIRHVSLAFIFAFQRMIRDSTRSNIGWTLFLFAILFLVQNRTSLLAVILMSGFVVYSMKMSARKLIIIVVVVVTVVLMAVYTSGQWGQLYQMTVSQVLNPEYNRNKALAYMFSTRDPLRYLLGEGFISANVNPIILTLQESGIYHSDVGLVGLWHMYGVIPAAVVLVMTLKGLSRKKSFAVRAAAIYILTGTLTLSFFAFGETLLWLSVYLYMYYVDGDPAYVDNRVTKRKFSWTA